MRNRLLMLAIVTLATACHAHAATEPESTGISRDDLVATRATLGCTANPKAPFCAETDEFDRALHPGDRTTMTMVGDGVVVPRIGGAPTPIRSFLVVGPGRARFGTIVRSIDGEHDDRTRDPRPTHDEPMTLVWSEDDGTVFAREGGDGVVVIDRRKDDLVVAVFRRP